MVLVLALLAQVPALYAQKNNASLARLEDIELDLELRQAEYKAGDPIEVRLTLRNKTDHMVLVPAVTHTTLAPLRVIDANGRELRPGPAGIIAEARGYAGIEAWQSVTLENDGGEWLDLRDWGYDVRTPGTYTVFTSTAPIEEMSDKRIRSNQATFTITGAR
jgi:hypothetical protein